MNDRLADHGKVPKIIDSASRGGIVDRITTSLLNEFAAEYDLGKSDDSKKFEHFAAHLCVSRSFSDTFATGDVVTGGGADLGIDAIAMIVNGSLVTEADEVLQLVEQNGYLDVTFIFVQAEKSESFDVAKLGNFCSGILEFFSDTPVAPRNNSIEQAERVMAAIYEKSSKFKRGNPVCKIFYVTAGKWTEDRALCARRDSEIARLDQLSIFREVEFTPVGAEEIQRLYNQTKNSISRTFEFPLKNVIPSMPGVSEAYLGLVPAKEFLKIVQDESGNIMKSIFYDNVRDWQDYNAVNTGIKDTLRDATSRSRFVLMNNGITVIAKDLRVTGTRVAIEDYQVVNGCQTSHVLQDNSSDLDASVMVPLRLIATQDENIITSIITATNRQTAVREEQLLALSEFQKKLENFFQTFEESRRLYYERRSRQYNGLSGIEKTRIVTLQGLIRSYVSMFADEPHRTTKDYKRLVERVGKTIFVPDDKLEPYYVAAYAAYRLEYLFRSGSIDAAYKPARFQILFALRLLKAGAKLPRRNSREMERFCEPLMELLADSRKMQRAFKDAVALVEEVSGGTIDDRVRTQGFTEALRKVGSRKKTPAKG